VRFYSIDNLEEGVEESRVDGNSVSLVGHDGLVASRGKSREVINVGDGSNEDGFSGESVLSNVNSGVIFDIDGEASHKIGD